MRWPGKIPAGTTNDGIASATDFLATFADLVEASIPDDVSRDSISLTDTMLNGAPSKRESFAYFHGDKLEAVRLGKWKRHYCKIIGL